MIIRQNSAELVLGSAWEFMIIYLVVILNWKENVSTSNYLLEFLQNVHLHFNIGMLKQKKSLQHTGGKLEKWYLASWIQFWIMVYYFRLTLIPSLWICLCYNCFWQLFAVLIHNNKVVDHETCGKMQRIQAHHSTLLVRGKKIH